jgi:hypothetical protein
VFEPLLLMKENVFEMAAAGPKPFHTSN